MINQPDQSGGSQCRLARNSMHGAYDAPWRLATFATLARTTTHFISGPRGALQDDPIAIGVFKCHALPIPIRIE
jgi:hypothetical protein